MKGGIVAAAAILASGANAHGNHHAHDLFHKRNAPNEVCVTRWTTILGPPTLVPPPVPKTTSAPAAVTTTSAAAPPPPPPPSTSEAVLPTPHAHSYSTPGIYTVPATTITVKDTTTVCGASSTTVPAGTHTVGGVTTIVETSTTVTCPYATVQTSGTVTTSTILTTTYVCPSAGTYTVAPTTTVVPSSTTVTYVVPTTIAPGTYTAPQQVITVTETDYVTWCPFSSSLWSTSTAAPVSTYAPPPPPPPPASTTAPAVTYAPPPPPASSSKYVAPPATSSSAPPPSSGSGGALVGDNDHYGMTYTPYSPETGDCLSASQVDSDLAAIKGAGFQVVRVYSTDCNTLESVGNAAANHGLDLFIGIFVKESGCSSSTPDIKEQIDAISAWARWDLVKLFVVSNEAISNGYCTAGEVAQLITDVKSACGSYTGPYTIAETLNIWQEPEVASAIVEVVEVCGANIHPYFNAQTTPETAGDFVESELVLLKGICPGKQTINLECGWPTAGVCNGSACPGEEEQAVALKSIRDKTGDTVIFFSTNNDLWKDNGSCACEQHWGCSSAFGF